jgi:hypothetical protein
MSNQILNRQRSGLPRRQAAINAQMLSRRHLRELSEIVLIPKHKKRILSKDYFKNGEVDEKALKKAGYFHNFKSIRDSPDFYLPDINDEVHKFAALGPFGFEAWGEDSNDITENEYSSDDEQDIADRDNNDVKLAAVNVAGTIAIILNGKEVGDGSSSENCIVLDNDNELEQNEQVMTEISVAGSSADNCIVLDDEY